MDPAVAQRWYVLLNQHAQIEHDATQRQSLGFDHSGDMVYYPGHDDSSILKVTGAYQNL